MSSSSSQVNINGTGTGGPTGPTEPYAPGLLMMTSTNPNPTPDKYSQNPTIYNLRWEDYDKIILDNFCNLLNNEELLDCTLVVSPHELLKVHRLVLCANSPYFRSLLQSHSSHPHPIIILHDVNFNTLKSIVNFMYRGTVNVSSLEMPNLLKTAESLQILGLSQTTQTSRQSYNSGNEELKKENLPLNPVLQSGSTVYSKKARILDQQMNFNHQRNISGNSESIPEQLSPLALRKEPVQSVHHSSVGVTGSVSAPTTPGGIITHSNLQYHDIHYSSNLNSPNELHQNHLNNEEEEINEEEEEELEEDSMEQDHHHSHHSSTTTHTGHATAPTATSTPTQLNLRYSCPYCSSSNFPSQSQLSRHIMLLHPSVYTTLYNEKEEDVKPNPNTPNPSIVCKFCGKPFPEVSQLIQHLPIHTGERPFKCEFCGKAFKLRHHMKDHARVHTGERPFRCSLCGKTFSRSTILKAHEKTHFPKASGGGDPQVSPGGNSGQGQSFSKL